MRTRPQKIPEICPYAEDIAIKQITYGKMCRIDGLICFAWKWPEKFTKCPHYVRERKKCREKREIIGE